MAFVRLQWVVWKYEVDSFTRATTDFSKGREKSSMGSFWISTGRWWYVADKKHIVCKICQAKVGYSRNLKQHLQSHHSDMLINQLINGFNHGNYRWLPTFPTGKWSKKVENHQPTEWVLEMGNDEMKQVIKNI